MARNDGIDRTSARNQCFDEDGVGKIEGHNEREKATYTNPDIDQSRSWMNVHYKAPSAGYAEMFAQMEQDGQISTRGLKPDADHYCEMVFDVNTAYFHNHGGYEYAKEFFAEAYKAAVEIVGGEQYILSAVMHADEKNRRMSEELGYDVFHYHLHVVYIPVVEKQIKWSKRCKNPKLVGTVKETIMQVSASKKWKSDPALDENGKPKRDEQGRLILNKSYSILQDQFYDHMVAAGYTDIQRGEKGSTEEHLTVLQFKTMKEQERLAALEAQERMAREEAERSETARLQAEQEARQAQAQLNQLTVNVKDTERFMKKLGEPEKLLQPPGLLESAKAYRENKAMPVFRKIINFAANLYQRLKAAQKENADLKAERDHSKRRLNEIVDEMMSLQEKAGKFDKLVHLLGIDKVEELLHQKAEHMEQEKNRNVNQER